LFDGVGRAIARPDPNDARSALAEGQSQGPEIGILGNDDIIVFAGERLYRDVIGASQAQLVDVSRPWEDISQPADQGRAEIFVKQQLHAGCGVDPRSRSRSAA